MKETLPQRQKPTSVGDLMTTDVQTLGPDNTVDDARTLILVGGINSVPVTGRYNQPLGIITSHDLVEELAPEVRIQEVMEPGLTTIGAEASLAEAAEVMRAEYIHHLVVIEGGSVIGVLSTFDLLSALIE